MKDGQVEEFDTPLALLKNKRSQFSQMVEKTGVDNAHRLYQMALEANKKTDNDSGFMFVSAV